MTNLQKEINACPVPVKQVKSIIKELRNTLFSNYVNIWTAGVFLTFDCYPFGIKYSILLRNDQSSAFKLFILMHEVAHYYHRNVNYSPVQREKRAQMYALKACMDKGYYDS